MTLRSLVLQEQITIIIWNGVTTEKTMDDAGLKAWNEYIDQPIEVRGFTIEQDFMSYEKTLIIHTIK